jgi:transposase
LVLITNVEEEDVQKIYEMYKSRHAIEQMYDVFKNVLEADRMYVLDKETLEGWMFVHYLAMVYWYRIQRKLKEKRLESKYSPKDIIDMLSRIQNIQIGEEWKRSEYPKKCKEILEKLEICIV